MKRFVAVIAMTAVLCVPASAQKVVSQIAAKVNKDIVLASEIKKMEDELRAELADNPKLSKAQVQQMIEERSKDVLRELIDKYLIRQEANDLGLDCNLEVLKQIEQLRVDNHFASEEALEAAMVKQGVAIDDVKDNISYKCLRSQVIHKEVTGKMVITNEEQRVYYEAHKQEYDRPPGVNLGMIAVATDGLSPSEIEAKKQTMADVLVALKRGDDFAEVARKTSEDPSAPDGGTIGFVERASDGSYGLASPEMEAIVSKLTKGQITDVITNPQNHTLIIFKLLDKHDGGILPFEIAQPEIYGQLMDERAEPRVRAYLTKLRAEGYVEVYPGYTDTGASTKPVRASDTTPPRQ